VETGQIRAEPIEFAQVPVDGGGLVIGDDRSGQPDPAQPPEQLSMRAWRHQMRVQDRVHLVLDRVRCRTTWLRRATSRRRRSVSASASQISGRKSAPRSDARTPASILSVLTCAWAIALTWPRQFTSTTEIIRAMLAPISAGL